MQTLVKTETEAVLKIQKSYVILFNSKAQLSRIINELTKQHQFLERHFV